ncbi:MAG: porin [Balneolaceae bacterium]|nr:porin [Balneolaceae bacterium]
MKTSGIFGVLLLVWTSITVAQENSNSIGEFSGVIFSDYYWIAASHNNDIEGENGFWIRRVYFTYDKELGDSFSARFRLEGSSPGDFQSVSKISPVVKDLYLRWQNGQHQIEAGISSTPTWGLVEDVWGYRSVEKSPLDLQSFSSSRDFGLSFEGELDPEGRMNYHFMFGNGNSNKSENNRGKKFMLSLGYELSDHWVVEIYGDYSDNIRKQDWVTLQGFTGYQSDDLNFGFLFVHQHRKNQTAFTTGDRMDLNLQLASAFTNFTISPTTRGFFRVDHSFDPIRGVEDTDYFPLSNLAPSTIIIGGVDFDLGQNIHLMPNIETVFYEESDLTGITPESGVVPRLTLSYAI